MNGIRVVGTAGIRLFTAIQAGLFIAAADAAAAQDRWVVNSRTLAAGILETGRTMALIASTAARTWTAFGPTLP